MERMEYPPKTDSSDEEEEREEAAELFALEGMYLTEQIQGLYIAYLNVQIQHKYSSKYTVFGHVHKYIQIHSNPLNHISQ